MKKDVYDLTAPQNSIWLTEQFYQDTNINNICGSMTIFDKVDFNKFTDAINIFVKNTDSFRIKLFMDNSEIKQYVSDFLPFDLEIIDVSSDEDVKNIEMQIANIHFNLMEDLLFTFKLFRFPDGHGGFVVNAHHIISDSWTLGIVVNKIIKIYSCLLNNEDIDFSDNFSYTDYIKSEKDYLNSDKFSKDKQYWDNIYSTVPEIATIPSTSTDNTKNISTNADRELISIDANQLSNINKFCTQNKVSIYNFFMAVFSIYLSRVSNLDDFVIGTPILNRTNFKEKHTAGMFINTIPFRISINHNETFKEFVSKIAIDSLGMLRHQKYSYQYILENLRKQDSSLPNLYSVMLSYQVTKMMDNIDSIPHSSRWTFNKTTSDDLDIHLYDFNDASGLNIAYDYKIDKYSKEDIIAIHTRVLHIINQIINDNEIYLKNIEIVTPEEKHQILFDFNNTSVDYPKDKTVVQLFEEQAKKSPDSIAVVFEDQKLTYKELNEKANQLAHYLKDNGVKNNDIIGIMVNRSLEMIVGILAILKSGAAYLPIDPDYPIDRISYMLEDSNCNILLTQKILNNKIKFLNKIINIDLNNSNIYSICNTNLNNIISSEDLAYIIYTSGSTGKPKGVMLKHKALSNLINYCNSYVDYLKNNTYRTIVSVTTVSFDIFIFETLISLQKGLKLVIANQEEQTIPRLLNNLIEKENIEIIQTTPSRMQLLLNNISDIPNIKNLKYITLAGEQLPISLVKELVNLTNGRIYNGYGPSETTVFSTLTDVTNYNQITIGKPLNNTQIYILDNNHQLCPIGISGEIYISGDGIGKGYINRPDLNSEKFIPNPFIPNSIMYKTGDLGFYTPNGEIICLGRCDNQIKIRGLRIELDEIENLLSRFSNASNYVVTKKTDNNSHEFLCAYYTKNTSINVSDLRTYLQKQLPKYMVPQYFIELDALPYTPNGKIDRKALPMPSMNNISANIIPARNDIDKTLINILKQLLNINNVSIDNSFFDLGGDSLTAINLCMHIFKQLNIQIAVKDILNTPIISELSDFIASKSNESNIELISKAEPQKYYPVSSAQKRMYYASSLDGENSLLYNIAGGIILNKTPDINKLEQCFKTIINRHESLRTYFEVIDGNIVQKIAENIDFKLEVENSNSNDIDSLFNNFVKPFNLNKAPLFNARLIKLANNKCMLLLNMHHIISDGTSLSILIDEICKLYNNSGKLPELSINYKDFAVWENNKLNNNEFKESEEFWVNQFKEEIPLLNMPTNYTRPTVQNFEGNSVYLEIDSNLTENLNSLSKQLGITPYMLLLSIYYILLYKYTGQDDIVVGSPIVGRDNFQLSNIIGMFVNSLALRNKIDSSLTFTEFATNIKENCLKAFEHQTYPFDELINKLEIKRDTSRNPLFDTMFIYQNNGNAIVDFDGIKAENYIPKSNISKFDLSLEIIPENNILNLRFEYCTKLFNEEFITRLSKHYTNILQVILENKDIKIADIDMLSQEEKHQILFDFNNTSVDYPKDKTVVQLFEEQVKKSPDSIAVVFEDQKLTYKELNEKANQLAHYLKDNGVKNGDIVSICMNKNISFIITILAIQKSGCAYLPINPNYPLNRIDYIIENSKSKLLITESKLEVNSINNINISNLNLSNYNNKNLNINISTKNLAYVIYTSGSTGTPKGVMITHSNLTNFLFSFNNCFNNRFGYNDNCLSLTNISFDVSVCEIFTPLTFGCTLVLYPENTLTSIPLLCQILCEQNITFLYIPPSVLNEVSTFIIDNNLKTNINKLLVGVESIKNVTLNKFLEINPNMEIINGYGPTETTICTTFYKYKLSNNLNNTVPIGYPISNSKIFILDKDNNVLPIGCVGELCVSGDNVSLGYLNNIKLTNNAFIIDKKLSSTSIYKTGDLAYWKSNGIISFIGRNDSQIKFRGHRIELNEIDSTIRNINHITNSLSIIKTVNGIDCICSYITSNLNISTGEIYSQLTDNLPYYMIPSHIIILDKFPLTLNGKIDKNKLPDVIISSSSKSELNTDIEIKLGNSICQLLHINTISKEDNFFDLGLDSLSAIKLVTEIYNKFHIDILIKDVFENATIHKLSNFVNSKLNSIATNVISKAEPQEYYPVSSAQKRMYYASSLDGENSLLYNIAGGIILNKTPDINKLEQCFKTIISRHESLRTYFEVIGGNIVQKIAENIDFKLEVENSNSNDIDSLFNNFVKPFNLNKAPLFNAKLIKLANNKCLLLLNMHHIISDGTSLSILIDELCKLYNNSGKLPELSINYKDFAVWENNKLNNNEFKESEEFWVNQFKSEIPLLNMPTNYPRPTVQSFEGNSVYLEIDSNLTDNLNTLSKQLGITPYMLLLSIYYILLYKYTGQDDIVVGSPIVGRDNFQLSNIIGMFVNSLALRNKIDSSLTFTEFATNIKENCLKAFEHQTYPFDELINKLEIKRDTSRNPLFDTMFIYQNNGNATVDFDGINAENYIPKSNISKFDLSLEIIPENNILSLRFEYCTKLFNEEFITRLSKHYTNILQVILENKDIKIADIDMLSQEEKHQILFDFNNTSVDYPKDKTVVQLFEEQVKKSPDSIAVVFEDQKLTYKELNEKANQLAHYLKSTEIQENNIIGIMLERSFETIICMLAVLKSNSAYMLIDHTLPEDRILYMLNNAHSPLLITSSNMKNIDFNKIFIDSINLNNYSKNNLNLKYDINNNLSVVYTSGSTGLPKGVLLKQQGMINLISCYKGFIKIHNFSNFLSICSVSFDMFAVEIFIPLLNCKTLFLTNDEEHKDPISISKLIKENSIEFMMITPSKIQLLLTNEYTIECLQNLKSIQLGGEALTPNLYETLKKFTNAQICNEYGPSEITSCCSFKEIESANNINIGRPINNAQIYILNKDMNLCPIDVEGEICVSGDGLSKGYINNPTATNKVFVQNPFKDGLLYKTGDIGKYNSNGELEYIGRKDFQVKLRGLRIELSEIEKQLLNIPHIKNCAIIYKEQPENNSYLAAFYTSTENIDSSSIRAELSKYLPLYMVPKYIIQLENMPITRNGKIDLKALKNYEISTSEIENYVAPENELQKLFCDTWGKLLNTKVGINNDIFELGADSLLAIKFKVEMLAHNVDVQYADIFKYPTIKALSEVNTVSISEQLDNYDYTKINSVLEKNNIRNYKNIIKNTNNNVLLLGANGFVGMHILYNFIKNDEGKIYCIVRDKNKLSARTRFLDALHFYFNTELDEFIDNRIIILKGDITKENFGLQSNTYDEIVSNVSIVINSSANVKHYGNFKNFENINIGLTKKAIDFCEKYTKRLIQISSTSVCGNIYKDTNITFSENNLYIGQSLDNVYIKSKFEAERIVLEHISTGLNAQILRLGNITNRYSDGKFQINPDENAFVGRLQSFIKLGVVPDYLLNTKLEFTPVDLCGYAILLIMQNYVPEFSVFHLYNNNSITMKELIELLKQYNINLNIVTENEFNTIVKETLMDDNKKDILSGIINELNTNNKLEINLNIDIMSEFSRIFLNTIDFNWLKIDNIYIEKYINYLKYIKFI